MSSQMRVSYIAEADLSNINAHAIQVWKNVQAWAKACPDFELVVNLTLMDARRLDSKRLAELYGLRQHIALTAFPLGNQYGRFKLPIPVSLYFRLAAKRCRERKVDLVYCRSYFCPRHTLAQGLPTLVEGHTPLERIPAEADFASQVRHPLCLGLVTISQRLADLYVAAGLPAEKIIIAPDGVDLDAYRNPLDKAEARRRLGLDPGRPLAVYAGHLYQGRGVEHIMEAARQLPRVDFLLVGGHPGDVERWKNAARGSGLGNVIFTGFVNNGDVPGHLWAGDALLMPYGQSCPTVDWMSPLKMFEYMAAGRPIIASDLPALRSVLSHGVNAWLCPPDQHQGLVQALEEIMASPELARRLAERAQQDVLQYSWDSRVALLREHARRRIAALPLRPTGLSRSGGRAAAPGSGGLKSQILVPMRRPC